MLILSHVLLVKSPLALGHERSQSIRKSVQLLAGAQVNGMRISEPFCCLIFSHGGYWEQRNDFKGYDAVKQGLSLTLTTYSKVKYCFMKLTAVKHSSVPCAVHSYHNHHHYKVTDPTIQ